MKHNFADILRLTKIFDIISENLVPEPGTSGLEKTAPSGELEFSSRSN